MKNWIFKRFSRHCIAEFFRADLRVRLLRVPMYDRAPFWLLMGLKGIYEYHLEFSRRGTGKDYARFKTFATIRHLDMPNIAELLKPVNRYLNGIKEPEEGFAFHAARELVKS